ncbi:MAG: DUF971 domain-containing protein [Planctomycetota bacterium]
MPVHPVHLDLKRSEALTIRWSDGRVSVYPVGLLRRLSPSADAQQTRQELAQNPLAVLASSSDRPLRIDRIEPVGRYAIRLVFSDGHQTGLYTWAYLRDIDPDNTAPHQG